MISMRNKENIIVKYSFLSRALVETNEHIFQWVDCSVVVTMFKI